MEYEIQIPIQAQIDGILCLNHLGHIEGNEDQIPIKGQIDGILCLITNLKAYR